MAKEHSFDITAEVDKQHLKDAYEQAKKIITNRWDFKGVTCEFNFNEKAKVITLTSANDSKAEAMFDAIVSEAIKRNISSKSIKKVSQDTVGGANIKITVNINDTLNQNDAKEIVKKIKELGLKVKTLIRGEEVRVIGKSIDDLQVAIKALNDADMDIPLNFVNMK
ncbi:MAG: YajQ family cyclic di-GMP-binding protein [Sulfurospirillum sp.]|nr:YajQ family cyclic di-GMP-binding protein [Sulfurospirillum sp.]MBL0703083.1 YajQ family cyclic di-GMP-binding protein [Sulfurospirillum sp.]